MRTQRPPSEERDEDSDGSREKESRAKRARNSSPASTETLAHAQFLESRSKHAAAIACYDEVLAEEPSLTAALVGKARSLRWLNRREEAFEILEAALKTSPRDVGTLCLLGLHYRECGKLNKSVACFKKAWEIDPEDINVRHEYSQTLNDLGTFLKMRGQVEEAIEAYEEALRITVDHANACYNLGVVYGERQNWSEAIKYYQLAANSNPNMPEVYCNVGVIYKTVGNIEMAVECYKRALQINPKLPFALKNIAVAMTDLATKLRAENKISCKEAMRMYKSAIAYNPACANAHYNLGVIYSELGKIERATAAYKLAVEFDSGHAMALNNLGVFAKSEGRLDVAIDYYEKAVEAAPQVAQILNNLGVAYTMIGRIDDAMRMLKRALDADKSFVEVYNNLGILFRDECEIEESVRCYRQCIEMDPFTRNAGHNLLLAVNYISKFDAEAVYREHRQWGERFASRYVQYQEWNHIEFDPERPLVIGYISPDYFTHSVSYFIESVLRSYDKKTFKTICYANVERPDRKTTKLQQYPDAWRNVFGVSTDEVCEMIRRDKVDILVEITGHTAGNRLDVCARKPAPLQVTWIGYPNTTGLATIDYRFADELCDPMDTQQKYSEKLYRLPKCFLCYTPSDDTGDVVPLPCLTNGFVTFGSFNNLAKITEEVVELWCRILRQDPKWRMFIKAKSFATERIQQKYFALFAKYGVASHRVDLVGLLPHTKDHLQAYQYMDLSLDTFPYAGTTTTCEALYMGVPVITLKGDNHAQNVGVSLLSQIEGHSQYIAENKDEYVRIAVELARDVSRLKEIRQTLRQQMKASYLCNASEFTANVEAAYRDIWRRKCAEVSMGKETPPTSGSHITVDEDSEDAARSASADNDTTRVNKV